MSCLKNTRRTWSRQRPADVTCVITTIIKCGNTIHRMWASCFEKPKKKQNLQTTFNKKNAKKQIFIPVLLLQGCRHACRLASGMTITIKTSNNGTIGKQACSGSTHFIRLHATFVTTSLPPSNRRGMRLAKRYTFTPSFTWRSKNILNSEIDAKEPSKGFTILRLRSTHLNVPQDSGGHAARAKIAFQPQFRAVLFFDLSTTGLAALQFRRDAINICIR